MKVKLTLILFAAFTFTVLSCKNEALIFTPVKLCNNLSRNIDSINLFLKGEWNWIEDRTIDRSGNTSYLTPRTAGYKERILITGDTISFYRNSIFHSAYKFALLHEYQISMAPEDINMCIVLYELDGSTFNSYYPLRICEDQLIFEQTYRSDYKPDRIFKRFR